MKKSLIILLLIFLIIFLIHNVFGVECTGTETADCNLYSGNQPECITHYQFYVPFGDYEQCTFEVGPDTCAPTGASCTLPSCTDSDGDKFNVTGGGSCGTADCNDANASVWQNLDGFIDADSDTYTTGTQISVCTGATLPTNYSATNTSIDCDDTNSSIYPGQSFTCGSCGNDGQYSYLSSVCRASTNSCDPTETCSGSSIYCSADSLSSDGTSCTYSGCASTCLTGACQEANCGTGGGGGEGVPYIPPVEDCFPDCRYENGQFACFKNDGCGGFCYNQNICGGLVYWFCSNWTKCSNNFLQQNLIEQINEDYRLLVVVSNFIVNAVKKLFGVEEESETTNSPTTNSNNSVNILLENKTRTCVDATCQGNYAKEECVVKNNLIYNPLLWALDQIPQTSLECPSLCDLNKNEFCSELNYECGNWNICNQQTFCGDCSWTENCQNGKCVCEENWKCSWSECEQDSDGKNYYFPENCLDINNCGTNNLPEKISCDENIILENLTQSLLNWSCSDWSGCTGQEISFRNCVDVSCDDSNLCVTENHLTFNPNLFYLEIPETTLKCFYVCDQSIPFNNICDKTGLKCGKADYCGRIVDCNSCSDGEFCSNGKCVCEENWNCDWTECEQDSDGKKYYFPENCVDENNCGTQNNFPEKISCDVTIFENLTNWEPNWVCTDWSNCTEEMSFRNCVDVNCYNSNLCITQNHLTFNPLINYGPIFPRTSFVCEDVCPVWGYRIGGPYYDEGFCSGLNYECGEYNNCGSSITCGDCSWDKSCVDGKCICEENWNCDWTECEQDSDGNSYSYAKNCVEINNCGTTLNKPEKKICYEELCLSNWECSDWGECEINYSLVNLVTGSAINGVQEKICSDENNCEQNYEEEKNCEIIPSEEIKSIITEDPETKNKGVNFFLESPNKKAEDYWHCLDKKLNYDEEQIDCGGKDCFECLSQTPYTYFDWLIWVKIFLWIWLLFLLIIFLFLKKEWVKKIFTEQPADNLEKWIEGFWG